ncbi:MAG TPA: hypothetical protein VHU40_21145, partial [Polyangia bacterium]|nr:hypothetical protein [Polyangia bacterium]
GAEGPDAGTNASEIHRITGRQPLGTLRYLANPSTADLARAASTDLELSGLLAALPSRHPG